MPDLVTLSDLKVFLGVTDTDSDAVLTALLDEVEGLFEVDCGRKLITFGAAADRSQVLDGTGSHELYLERTIASLRSITLGVDPDNADEDLDVSDPNVISFAIGERRITRVDGGVFGVAGAPRYVKVVYGSAADTPVTAKIAVKRGCAILFRQRGSEDATKEAIPDYSRDLQRLREDDVWQLACAGERRLVLA